MFPRLLITIMLAIMAASSVAHTLPRPPLPRPPLIISSASEAPVRLQSLHINADISGGMAETTVRMVLFNPNGRALEGDLQFPLLEGQQVTAFALDIDGKLRPAVPVEKTRGRQIFEAIERRNVDPGLLEQTQGNNFKLRIYPIPSMGTRTIELKYAESLTRSGSDWSYRLPLAYGDKLQDFDLTLKVHGSTAPPKASGAIGTISFIKQGGSYQAHVTKTRFSSSRMLHIQIAASTQAQTYVQERDGETYFATELPVSKARTPRALPNTISLLWDSSGSGNTRQHEAEFAVLDRYFKAIGTLEVRLTRLRDRPEETQLFRVENGQWGNLRKALESTVYDGASALTSWVPQADIKEYVLVSDGLLNYGNKRFPTLIEGQRLYVLSAAVTADVVSMAALAERSGGRFIAIQADQLNTAADALLNEGAQVQLLGWRGASEVMIDSNNVQQGLLRISGKLSQPAAEINLAIIEQGRSRNVKLAVAATAAIHPLAAHLWANGRLRSLEADYEANRSAIRRLGTQFAMPTRETSLIVLDRLEDYVRYELTPPADYLAAYEQMRAMRGAQLVEKRQKHLEKLVREFEQKISWWEKTYPKDAPPKTAASKSDRQMSENARSGAPLMASAPAPVAMMAAPSAPPTSTHESAATTSTASSDTIGIKLKKWTSDAPYIARMNAASTDTIYQIYLDEKPSYATSSAFYLDAADMLFDKGLRDLGLRVLSNLAELDLENRHILRILAYRLLQADAAKLAIPIFEKIQYLAEEEPQSFRDLGLAYAADKQYQQAINQLNEVILRPWDDRFAEIELIALAEMNAIIATAPKNTTLDTSRIDTRLIKNMSLDLRAVLTWDADNSDMDLWVTDPNGEKCFYSHRFTYQGGRMSRDFTGGYGPEEFSLRDAKPGKYKIEANFFGHRQQVVSGATTLQVNLSSGFGTENISEKMLTLRLKGNGQTAFIGEFEVKPK